MTIAEGSAPVSLPQRGRLPMRLFHRQSEKVVTQACHLERSEAESKFSEWNNVEWRKPTEHSEGEIYERSSIPRRGKVTSISFVHKEQ